MISSGVNAVRFARPYARAAFDYAQENNQLEQWVEMLRSMAECIQQPAVTEILNNPQYSAEIRGEVILALGQQVLNEAGQNFIKTLAVHQRLSVLPEIFLLFEQLRAAIEKTLHVQVKSAIALSDAQSAKLSTSLAKKWGRPVALEHELDSDLLGGFIVYAGDRVIDSSIRGQLEKLRNTVVG